MSVLSALRWFLAGGCAVLIGLNMAFSIYAKRMFPRSTFLTWRVFFIGKSFLTLYVGLSSWELAQSERGLTWRGPVGLTGLLVTNFALYRLYKVSGAEHGKEENQIAPRSRNLGFVTKTAEKSDREEVS